MIISNPVHTIRKLISIVVFTAVASGCVFAEGLEAQEGQETLSREQELKIINELKILADQYAIRRDNLDADGVAELFTEGATFDLNGEVFAGKKAIRERIGAAHPGSVSMHMMSSSDIDVVDENNATGMHYAEVYLFNPTDENPVKAGKPIPVKGPFALVKYADKYIRTDQAWKFSERSIVLVFTTSK